MGNCVESKVVSNQPDVDLEITTWQKESHGLYDYESKQVVKQNYRAVIEDSFLVREGNSINQVTQLNPAQVHYDCLIIMNMVLYHSKLIEQDWISKKKRTKLQSSRKKRLFHSSRLYQLGHEQGNKLWMVVSSMQDLIQDEGVIVEKGDIIKLGRIKMRVREINLSIEKEEAISMKSQHHLHDICRLCLSDSINSANPLINPCKCNGTMKYIHLECLQTWLRFKLHSRQNENCTIYLWKDLTCELCKFKYKPVFTSDEVRYDLVELSKPKGVPFVLLELRSKKIQPHQIMDQGDTFTQKACGIYIITFQNKQEVKFGRAHENEVRVSDISVSRCHAQLTMKNNQLFLKDLKSKFGTLILLKDDVELSAEVNGMKVQVGRSVVKFNIGTKRMSCFQK